MVATYNFGQCILLRQDKSAYLKKKYFLFLNQNICCGYLKEPSQWDGSFQYPNTCLN